MTNLEIRDEPPRGPRRFQFTIRSMLILTAGVALACSFVFAMPDWAAELESLCVFLLVPGPLVCLAIFGASKQKAFAIGTLVPWALFWVVFLVHDLYALSLTINSRVMFLLGWSLCLVSGYLSLLTQRWIERTSDSTRPSRASEFPSCDPPPSSKLDG